MASWEPVRRKTSNTEALRAISRLMALSIDTRKPTLLLSFDSEIQR
jgi:hypothetical protein